MLGLCARAAVYPNVCMDIYGTTFEYAEHVIFDPSWRTDEHTHSSHKLLIVVSGRMRVTQGRHSFELSEGDVLLCPGGLPHKEEICGPVRFAGYTLMFSLSGLAGSTITRIQNSGSSIRRLAQIMCEDHSSGLLHEIKMNSLTQAVIAEFLQVGGLWHESGLVMGTRGYIHAHLKGQITLDRLARHLGVSKYHYLREYKSLTGRTPMDEVRSVRLNYACQLLLTTSLSVKEIAQEVGLGFQQKLATLFQKEFGVAPTQYRSYLQQPYVPPVFPNTFDGGLMVYGRQASCEYSCVVESGSGWGPWNSMNIRGQCGMKMIPNQDGRLEAFVIGMDGVVLHSQEVLSGRGFTEWSSLGGLARQIAVGRNRDGRLELFAITPAGDVCNCRQTVPGGSWSSWTHLGGSASQVVVAENEDGRLELFCIDEDDKVCHNWQVGTSSTEWSGWQYMARSARQIAVGRNCDGRLELFALTTNRSLCRCWQRAPNTYWSGWANMGGVFFELAVASHPDRGMDLFAIGRGCEVYHNRQTVDWAGWVSLGGLANHIGIGRSMQGCLRVLAITPERELWEICETAPGGNWGNWARVGGTVAGGLDSF